MSTYVGQHRETEGEHRRGKGPKAVHPERRRVVAVVKEGFFAKLGDALLKALLAVLLIALAAVADVWRLLG